MALFLPRVSDNIVCSGKEVFSDAEMTVHHCVRRAKRRTALKQSLVEHDDYMHDG